MEGPLAGKTILVTGATSGIGKVTARHLAAQGATVVLTGRDAARTQATVREIQQRVPKSDVGSLVADLSSQAQVRTLAQTYRDAYPRLDVLIHNAGAMFGTRQLSVDGQEMSFAVNVFAPFLLTHLLRDTLEASAPARVITVASVQHKGQQIPFEDITHQREYKLFPVYGQSKLAALMWTYALARRADGTGVTANALHPGVVATNIGKGAGGLWSATYSLLSPFFLSAEKGAQTAIYLASSSEVAGVSGKYFVKNKPVPSSPASYDVAAQEQLWKLCQDVTGVVAAEHAS